MTGTETGTEEVRIKAEINNEIMTETEVSHPRKRKIMIKISIVPTKLNKEMYSNKENNKDSDKNKWINGLEIETEKKTVKINRDKKTKINKEERKKIDRDNEIVVINNWLIKNSRKKTNNEICKKVNRNQEIEKKTRNKKINKSRNIDKNKEIDSHPKTDRKIKVKEIKLQEHFRMNHLEVNKKYKSLTRNLKVLKRRKENHIQDQHKKRKVKNRDNDLIVEIKGTEAEKRKEIKTISESDQGLTNTNPKSSQALLPIVMITCQMILSKSRSSLKWRQRNSLSRQKQTVNYI